MLWMIRSERRDLQVKPTKIVWKCHFGKFLVAQSMEQTGYFQFHSIQLWIPEPKEFEITNVGKGMGKIANN